MTKDKKIKKTFYVNEELVKRIKIKSAVENITETEVVNQVLEDFFSQKENQYKVIK